MSHPEELLAEYVDGELAPEDRALVEAHLDGCARCRDEVAAAGRARLAVSALPDVEVPPGIALAVRREIGGRWSGVAARAGATAAAAAVVGALLWAGLGGGPGADDAAQPMGDAPAPAADEISPEPQTESDSAPGDGDDEEAGATSLQAISYPIFRRSPENYDPGSLAELAPRFAEDARGAIDGGFPPTAADFYASFDLRDFPERAGTAISCVTGTVAPEGSVAPFLVEEAAFGGKEAYLAVFLQGPEADAPYDRLTIVAVSREGCDPLHYAFQRL